MVENVKKIIAETEYFLLDMDGTLYIGDELIGEMDATLNFLRERGKSIVYLTNNSSKSKQKYIEKLKKLNLWNDKDEVYTSGMATADYINLNFKGKRVYLVGTEALVEEFTESGIMLVDDDPDICVLAFDTGLNYEKIEKFNKFISKGAYYIATHPDMTCPAPEVFIPDVGSFIELFKGSSGLTPSLIVGKPYSIMGENLVKKYRSDKSKFAMVGDRLHTDILFGNNCGFHSILVLSGESTLNDIDRLKIQPEIILENFNKIKEFY